MLPAPELSKNTVKIIINTGNVLNLDDIKKKAGQNSTEELVESLLITLKNPLVSKDKQEVVILSRANDDLHSKIAENERKDLKIGIKLFLNNNSASSLTEGINSVFQILQIECVDNLILAYNPKEKVITPIAGITTVGNGVSENSSEEKTLKELRELWAELEEYALRKQIVQLGLADVDSTTLETLWTNARVPPSIVQINLSACCVVPPELQALCKEKEIQLLTHSDPTELLTSESLDTLGLSEMSFSWAVRHQVHVRCRGVLACKGYAVGLTRE